jgi:hypothetical protein
MRAETAVTTGKRLMELALVIAMASGCQKKPTPVAPAPSSGSTAPLSAPRCFSVRADQNSAVTRAVFDEKHCQGGGVTWAAIVRVLLQRRGRSEPVLEPTPGWSGYVYTLTWDGGNTRWSLDDEGDGALFCADSARLVKEVEAQLKTLNSEKAALEDAMAAADPRELECFPSGASAAELLARLEPPPPLSPAEVSARQASLAGLRAALERQRTWCFNARGSVSGGKGGFTLHPDGRATTFGDGQPVSEGRWRFEDDGRLQLLTPRHLHYFDASSNGKLGFNHTGGREELTPCSPTP